MKQQKPKPVHPEVRIGHIHLKVADLDRALAFSRDVLGFELTQRYGTQAAFLSAGGYHHHIGLNTWESQGGSPPHRGATGLYHVAIVYPIRAELADALRRLMQAGFPHHFASDMPFKRTNGRPYARGMCRERTYISSNIQHSEKHQAASFKG